MSASGATIYRNNPWFTSAASSDSNATTQQSNSADSDYGVDAASTRPSTHSSSPPRWTGPQQSGALHPPPCGPQVTERNGLLLIVISKLSHSEITAYIEEALSRENDITSIAILGSEQHQEELKKLRRDIFGIAGRLSKELNVETAARTRWSSEDVRTALVSSLGYAGAEEGQAATGQGLNRRLAGVICDVGDTCLGTDSALDLESEALENEWKDSVGFVHAVVRGCVDFLKIQENLDIPVVSKAANGGYKTPNRPKTPYFVTAAPERNVLDSNIHASAIQTLMAIMRKRSMADGFIVGHADTVLRKVPAAPALVKLPLLAPVDGFTAHDDPSEDVESPMRLWSAAQTISYFD